MNLQKDTIDLVHSFVSELISGKIRIELLEDNMKDISHDERKNIEDFIEQYYSSDINNPTPDLVNLSSKIFQSILRLRLDGILIGEMPTSFLSRDTNNK